MLALLLAVLGTASQWAGAAEPALLKVGALRLASAGPLFIAQHERFFQDEGLAVEIRYFDAAQPIALAVTAGDVDLGVTAMTAGFFNIAGKGALKVIAGQAAIVKGRPGDVLMASNAAYAQGLRRAADLPGRSLAITQTGSSFHYELGLIAAAENFDIQRVTLRPLQSVSNMMAALKTGQVDGAIVSPQAAAELAGAGEAKLIAQVADAGSYRFGALFAASKVLDARRDAVARFVRAYRRGAALYNEAFFGSGARRKEVALMIAAHIMPTDAPSDRVAQRVTEGAYYVAPDVPLDAADVQRQVDWYRSQGFIDATVSAKEIMDLTFAR
ncbi:ABC transporter substrate-binding protein [Variovorax sp. RCC_210]